MRKLRTLSIISKQSLMILAKQNLSQIVVEDLDNAVFTLNHMILTTVAPEDELYKKLLERIKQRVQGELADRQIIGDKK